MTFIEHSELILNSDGSVYHLHLKPTEIAKNIILVGDPGRVSMVSAFFDRIEVKRQNREMITHTGYYKNMHVSVLSTGMGTDNIDIVMNELDALVNIDLDKREEKGTHSTLNIIRIGTSGALQPGIAPNATVVSTHGVGLDGMLYFYRDLDRVMNHGMTDAFISQLSWPANLPRPYIVEGSAPLLKLLGNDFIKGITATAPGFYGSQGRRLRLDVSMPELNEALASYQYGNLKITNFEMETSALYGLGMMLGHNTLTLTNIVANRVDKTFSTDYQIFMKVLIEKVLHSMTFLK
ncbi:MAG: nucleoside phosphorylase [Lentimicrobiaceae bacterium]